MEDIFLARQPIYNSKLDVVGYELLYRDSDSDAAEFTDGKCASSQLIINTFLGIGLENVVGSNRAFINLTHDFFHDDKPVPMNPRQVVLEVCMNEVPQEAVYSGLQQLVEEGYVIALDDFVYRPELEPLLKLAKIVKLDLSMHDREQLREQFLVCRKHGVMMLAEKVETADDLALCQKLGFDYFQGFYFSHPQIIRGRTPPSNRQVIIQLLRKLEVPDPDMGELEKVLAQDVALSYKLLRYINCASYAERNEVNSLLEALLLLGPSTFKKWAILLLMASHDHVTPQDLITKAMLRARLCELLAVNRTTTPTDHAFITGLFSTLDALMDMPMVDLLDDISLSIPIKFALLNREGELGDLLQQVLRHEMGGSSEIDAKRLSCADFSDAYLSAIKEVTEGESEFKSAS